MSTWMWAILLRPLGVIVFIAIAAFLTWLIVRLVPEGRIKRLLLRKWGRSSTSTHQ